MNYTQSGQIAGNASNQAQQHTGALGMQAQTAAAPRTIASAIPKADRAFWIGVKAEEARMAGECEDQIAARRATPSPPPKDRA